MKRVPPPRNSTPSGEREDELNEFETEGQRRALALAPPRLLMAQKALDGARTEADIAAARAVLRPLEF